MLLRSTANYSAQEHVKSFSSFHSSKHTLVIDKFLKLVAEEIRFSANETLKDIQNKKRKPARPIPTACSKCIGAFQISK